MQAAKRANPFRPGSQNHRILEYLQSGRKLTPFIIQHQFGSGSPTRRIADLRDKGFDVLGEWKVDAKGSDYMEYRLG